MITWSLKDLTDQTLKELDVQINRGLKAVGQKAEGYAKKGCPVDTGRLRNSIANKVENHEVYIGTNVEYAPYQEYGTSKIPAKHFLKNAATGHWEEYKNILETSLKT